MTLGCDHVFCPHGRMDPPEEVINTRGKTFQPEKRKHVLKRAENHRCKINTLGKYACNLRTVFKVSQRDSL